MTAGIGLLAALLSSVYMYTRGVSVRVCVCVHVCDIVLILCGTLINYFNYITL